MIRSKDLSSLSNDFFISVKTVENDQGPDPWYEVRVRNVLGSQPGAQARGPRPVRPHSSGGKLGKCGPGQCGLCVLCAENGGRE